MNGNVIGIVVVVLVILGGGWYVLSHQNQPSTTPTEVTNNSGTPSQTATSTSPSPTGATSVHQTITYTNDGFSPASLTVAQGTTVTFVNNSSTWMWVASNPHPTHQGYDGTTESQHCASNYTGPAPFDECTTVSAGGTFTFTFTKAGTWGYHNHALQSQGGSVTVTPRTGVTGSVNVTM